MAHFCYILCNFGEDRFTNPRDYAESFCTFWNETAKSTYHTKYLSMYWTELHQLFSIGRCMYADYETEIILAVVEDCNRSIFGPFCRRQNWPSLLFVLAFRNKMQHRFVNVRFNSCTNVSTSREILVNIGAVTSEFKRAKIENVPKLGCNLTIIVHLARWRSETDCNITILISAG